MNRVLLIEIIDNNKAYNIKSNKVFSYIFNFKYKV